VPAGQVDTRLYLVVQGEAVGVDPSTKRARGSVMRMGRFFPKPSPDPNPNPSPNLRLGVTLTLTQVHGLGYLRGGKG